MLLYHVCPCPKQVYLHIHLLHCHLHITMCHHLWTLLCEHICVNIHLWIVSSNAIVPCMSMHNASLSTSTSTTLPLAYHHVSPSVNNVWTLLCEHPSTNCFFKCYCTMYVHAQCKFIYIYIYYTATCISPCVTICEHCCVNTFVWTSICELFLQMLLYHACPCTMQVYLHLHLLHCHLHITICHHLWTMCEHYCVNIHLPIVSLNAIVPCMSMHNASLSTSTSTSTTLPLAYHHMSPSVNNVWTLLCEHASANCFFKHIWPFMSIYNLCLSTSTSTTLPLACHLVWTMCEHYCVNIHLSIVSLNALYPACPCTKQVYLHLLHCHLHITMCHHLWTMCEHYCVNIHLPIVSLNAIVPCMSMHNASLSTSTSTTLPLAYHHVSPSVNNVWTMCEHASTNCLFKCYCTMYVHAQCKFIYIYM